MRTTDGNPDRLRFGGIDFDVRTGELWTNGSRTVLPDQLFRILAMLVRERGSLVTRDELHRALWPDQTFVDFDHGLNAAIKRLREALGDSASAPRFIETIPRRGYRFVAAVESAVESIASTSTADVPKVLDRGVALESDPQPAVLQVHAQRQSALWTAAVVTLTIAG